MEKEQVLDQLTGILRQVFDEESLVASTEMTAEDVDKWDSLSHIDLIVMVEEHFGIKIPTWQVTKLKNVGELVDLVLSKKAGNA